MCFFLKYLVTLFYKKLKIKIVVSFHRESGPWLQSSETRQIEQRVQSLLTFYKISKQIQNI